MFDHHPKPSHYEYVVPLKLPLAGIIRIPPAEQKDSSYKNLICSEEDKALIFELIVTVAENTKFSLWMKQSHLRQIEAQIKHVHPLRFLATIFSNTRLKACMPNIFEDYFKRNEFMVGLGTSLTREASKGKLLQYLKDFALEVNVSETELKNILGDKDAKSSNWDDTDWEKLVLFLMNHD